MSIPLNVMTLIQYIERSLINIEKANFLIGDSTISAERHTTAMNKSLWNRNDWSQYGEEWTRDAETFRGIDSDQWKASLINAMIHKYIGRNSVVLEIGPGGGRWTQILQPIAGRLLLADVAEKCLSLCRERFTQCDNLEYYLIEQRFLEFLSNNTVDYIWSYDVFVHINPTDTDRYLSEFKRILKPGGCAIIHHPDTYPSEDDARKSFRSSMTGKFFAHLLEKHGFLLIEQNGVLPHKPGDLISVFRKPRCINFAP